MIKNIVFDIGNVIWKGKASSVLDKIPLTEKEKDEIKNTFFKNTTQIDTGEETLEEHFYKYQNSLTNNKNVKDFLLNYYKFRDFNLRIIELIYKLKGNGYNVYILSNNNKEAIEYLRENQELKCVDGWVVSCYYGTMKPEKKIYEILFNEFNIKPEESFFIDDVSDNINTALELGMAGYILENGQDDIEDLIKNMKEQGIDI